MDKEKTGEKNERQKFRKKGRNKKKEIDIMGSVEHTYDITRVCSQTDIPATMQCAVINGLTAPRRRCKERRFQHSEQPQDNGQTPVNATLSIALGYTYRPAFI
jgi:hypothetical protein